MAFDSSSTSKENNQMDKTLAEIYGTNQVEEADVEKLAAAELAEQLTETGDAQIDEETLEALAQEVLAQDDGETTEEQAVSEPEMDGAQEKIAEADYLGRVMAHSFVHESKEIAKTAGAKEDFIAGAERGAAGKPFDPTTAEKAKDAVKAVGGKVQNAGNYIKRGLTGKVATKSQKWLVRGGAGLAGVGAIAGGAALMNKHKEKRSAASEADIAEGAKRVTGKMRMHGAALKTGDAAKKVWAGAKNNKGKVGIGAGVLAAGGAAAYAAKKHKEKRSSAVDTLAEQRALEVLAEAGYDVDAVINAVQEYQAAPEQEKVSEVEGVNPYNVLADTVDARAEEMLNELVEAGIIAVSEETEQE
jgi:hypothetical protein